MSSPVNASIARIQEVVETVFAAEGWSAGTDKFGRSKGMGEPHDQASISATPDFERERPAKAWLLDMQITVQFYLGYDAQPDENISRDATVVSEYADRFRAAFAGPGCRVDDGDAWYLRFTGVDYPPDPTGNKTRFEATIVGVGPNRAALPS